MNLDDLLKSIREEDDDSKGGKDLDDLLKSIREDNTGSGKIDTDKFFKTKTFSNPLKGQRYQAPGLPSAPPVVAKPIEVKIDPKKIIPDNVDIVGEEFGDKIDELIEVIREDNKLEKKDQKEDKKQLEAKNKKDREDRIEGKKESKIFIFNLKKETGKIGGFFEKLKKFLKITLLSGLINTLYNFLTDPKNKEKIAATQKFLRNYWPAVLGALAYFFTPFGKLVNFVVGTVGKFLLKLGLLVAKNPILLAALGGAALGIAGSELAKQRQEEARERQRDFLRELGVKFVDPETGAPLTDRDKEFDPTPFLDTPDNPVQIEQREPGFLEKLRNTRDKFIFGTEFGPNQTFFPLPGSSILTDPSYQFRGGGFSMGTDVVPAMLTPGEFIMSRGAVNMFGADTMMAMNKMGGGTNRPKLGKVMRYQGGGIVDKNAPKITDRDYNALLAITSLEDTDPQGRADVAQSLYNRLYSAENYGTNYYQHERGGNDLFSIITSRADMGKSGGGQYEPAFGNPQDWFNITDRNSAAIAIMNSEKGRKSGYTMETALKMLSDTEKALSNTNLQKKAREHVGGRTYFFGTSQQGNMQENDVLRNPEHDNFFSMYYQENKPYDLERRNIGAPIPQRLQSVPKMTKSSYSMDSQMYGPAFGSNYDSYVNAPRREYQRFGRKIQVMMRGGSLPVGTPNIPTETKNFVLPPIDSPKQNQSSIQKGDIPSFNVVSGNKMRDLISKDLGIGDMVSAS